MIFIASMMIHMLRVYLTGAFRKPRELNWIIGCLLLLLGTIEASPATPSPTTCSPARASGRPTAS